MKRAFATKKFGVGRSWSDLATVEGYVFEVTGKAPTAYEFTLLINAARGADGQSQDRWEANPENIHKGLKTFKKNNSRLESLWKNPSRKL